MRTFVKAMVLGLASVAGSVVVQAGLSSVHAMGTGSRDPRNAESPITLRISAGYGNIYRDSTWTPVRVTLHNGESTDVSGSLQIPEGGLGPSYGTSQSFHALYQAPVTLPAGSTKQVTVFVPGDGVQGRVNATFRQGKTTLAAGSTLPIGLDTSALTVGVMASTPGDAAWLFQAAQQHITAHVISLSPATVDPVPQALATFDIIVLTSVDSSQFDRAQLDALQTYVRNGGSLLVIGGPSWQETVRPLPAGLLPGRIIGTRTLPNLDGLQAFDRLIPAGQSVNPAPNPSTSSGRISKSIGSGTVEVSVLAHPDGTILASQTSVPLAVRKTVGAGVIEYLAFDPALSPVQRWGGGTALLEHLVADAAPLAVSRTWAPLGFRLRFGKAVSAMAVTTELSNAPAGKQPLLEIFALLTILYVLLLGPLNFLVLRWLRRQYLAWITIPVLGLLYLASVFGVSSYLRGSAVVLNSVGMLTLDGSSGPHMASFYVGLVAPLPGDYHLAYNARAFPAPVPEVKGFSFRNAATLNSSPLGMVATEGPTTNVTFLSMKRWGTRDVQLDTAVRVGGGVSSTLSIGPSGDITGIIHNGTKLDLLKPALVAGQSATYLPRIPAGATVHVRARPNSDTSSIDSSTSVWSNLYGASSFGDGDGFGFGGGFDQISLPSESTLSERVQNATSMLAQTQTLSTLGEVVLVGWTEKPLAPMSVDGSTPRRRDLTFVAAPLSVNLPPRGAFQLLAGTIGAQIVDFVPRAPQSSCCGFFSRSSQRIVVGSGGSMTFEFDVPHPRGSDGRVSFRHLTITANIGGDGPSVTRVFDWQAHRWVGIDLSAEVADLHDPNRFVSPAGKVLLQVATVGGGGSVSVDDPNQNVQISGDGAVS